MAQVVNTCIGSQNFHNFSALLDKASNHISRTFLREDEAKNERPSNNWYQMTNVFAI